MPLFLHIDSGKRGEQLIFFQNLAPNLYFPQNPKIEKNLFCSSRFPESICKKEGIFSYQIHRVIASQSSKKVGIGLDKPI